MSLSPFCGASNAFGALAWLLRQPACRSTLLNVCAKTKVKLLGPFLICHTTAPLSTLLLQPAHKHCNCLGALSS